MNKIQEYERLKLELRKQNLSPEEYEKKIREIIKKIKI